MAAAVIIVMALPQSAWAATAAAKAGSKGFLDVEYVLEGKNSEQGKGYANDWNLKRSLKVTYEIIANEPGPVSALDESKNKAMNEAYESWGEKQSAVMENNADIMEKMAKAVEACGDDDDCITNAAMQMAQQPDTQKQVLKLNQDMQGVQPEAQAAVASSKPRFQLWMAMPLNANLSGEANTLEKWHNTVDECGEGEGESEHNCVYARERHGKQAIDTSMKTPAMDDVAVEVESNDGTLSVRIPAPDFKLMVDEKTTSGHDGKNEAVDEKVKLPFMSNYDSSDDMDLVFKSVSGRHGERTFKLKRLDDYSGTITYKVIWTFRGQ